MRSHGCLQPILACLVIAVMAFPSALLAGAQGASGPPAGASIEGTVLAASHAGSPAPARPVAGAVVKAVDIASGGAYESASTNESGAYRLSQLSPGSYAFSIQAPSGLYLSDGIIGVEAGRDLRLSFALEDKPAAPAGASEADRDKQQPPPQGEPGEAEGKGGEQGKKGNFWSTHPWLAGAVIAGSAVVLGVLSDQLTSEEKQKETVASPSSP